VQSKDLTVPPGSTVADALKESGVVTQWELGEVQAKDIGVWGRKAALSQVLREGDRIEIYRALTVDPKVARRERFAKQGSRSSGLFATRRAGAKAGY
jgi:putative ubiquitin-RnfH superfamily antitoxin RatB of RatAB toxin-antitoxin module